MTEASPPGVAPPQGSGSGSRRLKYALIASLAVNLLVVGGVGGAMYTFGKHPPRFGAGRSEDFGLMGLTRHLPEERRKELRKQLRQDREKLRPLVDDLRTARRDAADKLAAEPFDRNALESAFSTAGEKDRTLRDAAVSAFLVHAQQLTAEERSMLADWWRKKNAPFKERKGKNKDEADAAAAAK